MVLTGATFEDVWMLKYDELPFTLNKERTWHHHTRAKHVKVWREAGFLLSRQAKVPKMESAAVHCVTLLKKMNRDVGSEFGALKAFQDGAITDAGVMPDDRPPYVKSITFHAPIKHSTNAMVMFIVKLE